MDAIDQVFVGFHVICLILCFSSILLFVISGQILYTNRKQLYFIKRGILFLVISCILKFIFLNIILPGWIIEAFLHRSFESYVALVGLLHGAFVGIIDTTVSRVAYYFIQITRTGVASFQLRRMSIHLSYDFDDDDDFRNEIPPPSSPRTGGNDIASAYNSPRAPASGPKSVPIEYDDRDDDSKSNNNDKRRRKGRKQTKRKKDGTEEATWTNTNFSTFSANIGKKLRAQRDKMFIFRYYWLFGTPKRLIIVMSLIWLLENLFFVLVVSGIITNNVSVRYVLLITWPLSLSLIKGIIIITLIETKYKSQIRRHKGHWGIIQEFYEIGRLICIMAVIGSINLILQAIFRDYQAMGRVVLNYLLLVATYGISYYEIIWVQKFHLNLIPAGTAESRQTSINDIKTNTNTNTNTNKENNNNHHESKNNDGNSSTTLEKFQNSKFVTIIKSNVGNLFSSSNAEMVGNASVQSSAGGGGGDSDNPDHDHKQPPLTDLGQRVAKSVSLRSNDSDKNENGYHVNTIKVTKLSNFWDDKFDIINNYNYVRKEFLLFIDHCANELCMENVLFWVNIVQLMQFLIEFKYIIIIDNNDMNKLIKPLNINYHTMHHIKDTIFIENLKKLHFRSKIRNSNKHKFSNEMTDSKEDITKSKELNYLIFKPYYKEIYKEFLQREYAPYELNISHHLRERFSKYFQESSDTELWKDETYFKDKIWADLREAAMHIYTLLDASFIRFRANR